MKMRMIMPTGKTSAGNGGGTQNNQNNGGGGQMNEQMGGGQMNGMNQSAMPMPHHMPQQMPMPHAGPSPHSMPHHEPSQNGHPGMNMTMTGNYPPHGYSNNHPGMEMANLPMKLPLAAMHPQARAMGFMAPAEDYDDYGPDSYEPEARRRRSRRTRRYIRGAADDAYDTEMRGGSRMRGLEMHGGWDDEEDEGMGYAHSKPHGDKALKKKVKMLERKIEALQEALEEQGEEGSGGKKSKKKKHKHEPDDDDDEDDGAGSEKDRGPDLSKMLAEAVASKEFLKQLPTILTAVVEVIKNPPPTWPPYFAKNDLSGIFTMEARELMKAVEQYKTGQKSAQDVCKEMKHAGAALIQMYATLLHSINDQPSE